MKIEEVKERDLPEVVKLIREEFPYVLANEAKLKQRLEKEGLFLFKGIEGGKLVGFIDFEIMEADIGRINAIAVKEDARGNNFGKQIMEFAVNFLKKKGVKRITLIVKQENAKAKKLYQEAGFQFVGLYQKQIDGSIVEEMEFDIETKGEAPVGVS